MKRCPECRRDYSDETLNYCLDDGIALLDGPGSTDEPATAVLPDANVSSDAQTRVIVSDTADSNTRATSSAEYLVGGMRRNKTWTVAISLAVAVILGALIYG